MRSPEAAAFLERLDEVAAEVRSGADRRDRNREYAHKEVARLKEIGFWRVNVPVEHGGLGLDAETLVQAVVRLAGADGSLGQIPQNHFLTLERIRLSATPEQREHWLGRLGRGAAFSNGTAEPGELPPGQSATTLVRDGDGWLVRGRKVYCTGSRLADVIAVQLRREDGRQCTVMVELDAEGVVVHDDWQSLGQRTTASGSAEFHDVRVDDLAVIEHTSDPVAVYRISSLGQLLHAAIDAGIALRAVAEAQDLAGRVHGARGAGPGVAYGDDVLGVALLGELHVAALTAQRLVESAARRLAALEPDSPVAEVVDVFYEVAAAKLVSTRASLQVTAGLFEVGGSSSTHPRHDYDRYWRDVRTHTLHDAARWKPHAIGRWLLAQDVADPWSIGYPMRSLEEVRVAAGQAVPARGGDGVR